MVKFVRVFVRSFGCSSNVADGEVLAGCLREAGFELVSEIQKADIVIYNTCAVKAPTENRVIEIMRKTPKDKKVVVAGCLPLINFERLCREVSFHGVVGPAIGEKIVDVAKRVANGEKVVMLEKVQFNMPSLSLPRLRVNPVVSIVPVCYGCLGACTYCCVIFARGSLRSYSVNEIVSCIKHGLKEGVKEVWLTGQDVACYGRDIGSNLVNLLSATDKIGDHRFWVRVGMLKPDNVLPILDDLVKLYENSKHLFWFLHVPVQSGDDEVLKRMNRRYSVKDFKTIVESFRKACPNITIATDVIVGFPGETEEAFKKTMELLREVKPDIVNVSKFFARPNTKAEKMRNHVSPNLIKERSEKIAILARQLSLEKNKKWIGWEGEVLIDERGKELGTVVGRNFAYKPIVIRKHESLMGKFVNVRILDAFQSHLLGEILR
jgi:MiaB-like tRNA modifying enzyme